MKSGDLAKVVKIHLAGFSGFFLTFLGPAFLREFYEGTLADPACICFVAEYQGNLTGFVVGTDQPSDFYRRLILKHWWHFALASLAPFFKRPSIAPRLLRAFAKPAEVTHTPGRGSLMSIAVLPEMKGKGIGKLLVQAFLKEAISRGVKQVDLTTDSENNHLVNNFYCRLGFVCERTFITPEGRKMIEYVMDLQPKGMKSDVESAPV